MNTKQVANANKPAQAVTTPTPTQQPRGLVRQFAQKMGVDADQLLKTLKDTAFKQPSKEGRLGPEVTTEQMMALLVVANEYGLNPFLREIFAFPTKGGGITPMVSIDGWIRIVNNRPEFKAQTFVYPPDETAPDDYYVECIIERHDRTAPTVVREYYRECVRDTDPWKSHPRRMTRHKAFIQCARLAFGYGGIYDPDEAERIANAMAIDVVPEQPTGRKPTTQAPRAKQIAQEPQQPQPTDPPPADAAANADGAFQSLASEPDDARFPDEEEAGSRG